MKWRNPLVLSGAALTALGAGLALNSFLPQRFSLEKSYPAVQDPFDPTQFPPIEVTFLRCASVSVPAAIAVRGTPSLAPRIITHSAVLIQHPRATFLYDTGLCTHIEEYLQDQSFFFRNTLARFALERPLAQYLQDRAMQPADLAFVLLSHLHWDHVGGIPDLPGVPLRVNRVEYEAARHGLFDHGHNLIPRLMGDNPLELFDCAGPSYEGFRSSYDLFGDGSLLALPLPGHTAGHTGLLIQRANGPRLFLIGDAAWLSDHYTRPTTMHPFLWSRVTSDDATARQTLISLHHFSCRHPEIPLLAMHDASMQENFMSIEQALIENKRN